MSLRTRLSLLALALLLTTLAVGTVVVVSSARSAVAEETRSTATLAAELLGLALDGAALEDQGALRSALLARLEQLEAVRHLRVAVVSGNGNGNPENLVPLEPLPAAGVPAWFAAWVEPEPTALRRELVDAEGRRTEIVVSADPSDEIAEAWLETRVTLGLVLGLAFAGSALIYILIGWWLRPLATVTAALDRLQGGDYSDRLPRFALPELARLAQHFNGLASALEQSREENRRLTERSLTIQEQERRALAQELHDELGQSISAIKALAVSIEQNSGGRDDSSRTTANTITDICSHIYSVVRGMMKRLRPALLDEFGLAAALEEQVERWNEHFADTFCSLELVGRLDDLPDSVRIGVYRIVQECLTNVGKHARASEVIVRLERTVFGPAESLRITVADDGIGLESTAAVPGFGLRGIRERAEAMLGDVAMSRSDRGGLSVSVSIPLARRREAA